jgi:DNA-binding transcriptional ArsR family regulator
MSTLSSILSSRARARIFRLLFGCTTPELHNREIFRRTSLSESAIRQELGKLTRLGLVLRRRDGNRVCYTANRNHPLFPELRQLVLKTNGLVDILKPRLSTADIQAAFVHGALVRSEETGTSGIDLLVIGRIGQMGLELHLADLPQKLGREIKPLALTEAEYRARLGSETGGFTSILDGPKIFVIGSRRELEALAGKRSDLA